METKMTTVIGKVEKALEKLEKMEPRKGSALSKGIRNIASAKGKLKHGTHREVKDELVMKITERGSRYQS